MGGFIMMDFQVELEKRVDFIRNTVKSSGIVYGNSGGKDSALVGILCKMACPDTLGIQMPCGSKRNFKEDLDDALAVAKQFSIQTKTIDLSPLKDLFISTLKEDIELNQNALINISPRLRMMTLYSIAASENRFVAGTGNKSEGYMGYFTKWGDGACDFNVIADLTVTEIYEFLKFLKAPKQIIEKAPSAGLFDNQTDESEMGITYAKIDDYILNGQVSKEDYMIIEKFHKNSEHKRKMPIVYVAE
jgi:NAD+ synthase